MNLTADEIAKLPGRQVIAAVGEVLNDEDWRIRGSEEVIVAAGLRRQPDPEILSKADRFHALYVALDYAARAGPKATIKDFITNVREAWREATVRREIDASGAGDDQPGDETADPSVAAERL